MKEKFNLFTSKAKSSLSSVSSKSEGKLKSVSLTSIKTRIKNFSIGNKKGYAIFFGAILIIVFFASISVARIYVNGSEDEDRISPPKALASQDLKTKFEFPIRDSENEIVANVSYEIEKANLQNEFIYQGKLAKSVQGRTFLVFDLKITNPYEKGIEINTIDYIRVKRNGSEEQLAPEIHNDPVQIQANSTKYTRIGLPINETDKDLIILVGELQGDKKEVKLNF